MRVDNSGYLAAETYHRHQVPEDGEFAVWDQFRNPDGSPRIPQRPLLLGPLFAAAAAGNGADGAVRGEDDRRRVAPRPGGAPVAGGLVPLEGARALGRSRPTSTSVSGSPTTRSTGTTRRRRDPLHTVSYLGMLHQALRDVSRWVEEGVAPPLEHGLRVARRAGRRAGRGVDDVGASSRWSHSAWTTANERWPRCGGELAFRATAEVPPGTGAIVARRVGLRRVRPVCRGHAGVEPAPQRDGGAPASPSPIRAPTFLRCASWRNARPAPDHPVRPTAEPRPCAGRRR